MGLCPQHPEQCHMGIHQEKHSHGRRRGKAERAAECHPQGIHLRMEGDQGEGGRGAEEAEGEAGQEEGDQGRAGEEAQPAEEGRGGKLRKEEADKRAAEAEEKKKRLEEAEAKRQEMLDAQKADKAGAAAKKSTAGTEGNDARKEMTKTKEQLGEEKKIALSIIIKPLDLDAMDSDDLKAKATELFNIVIQLETDKYDYEQERHLQELKERQKAQLRQKALKKGLDPEALVGK